MKILKKVFKIIGIAFGLFVLLFILVAIFGPEYKEKPKEATFIKLDDYKFEDNSGGDFSPGSDNKRTLQINGSTNLPSGTVISILTHGFIISSRKGHMLDTGGKIEVQDGKFSVVLHPWNITDEIEFRVFSGEQSKKILQMTGKEGEKLLINPENKGEVASIVIFQSEEFKINEDIIAKIMESAPPVYNIQQASELKKPYEIKLAEFIKAWENRDLNAMAAMCKDDTTADEMELDFGNIRILGFKINSSEELEDDARMVTMRVFFTLDFEDMREEDFGIQKKSIEALIDQRSQSWIINPHSIRRGIYD